MNNNNNNKQIKEYLKKIDINNLSLRSQNTLKYLIELFKNNYYSDYLVIKNITLMNYFKVSESSVQRSIRDLKKKGYIFLKTSKFDNSARQRKIFLNLEYKNFRNNLSDIPI